MRLVANEVDKKTKALKKFHQFGVFFQVYRICDWI